MGESDMASVRAHYDESSRRDLQVDDRRLRPGARRGPRRTAGCRPRAGRGRGSAVDLGAGLGAHAVALTEAGYAVTAIDTCAPLLEELAGPDPPPRHHRDPR